MYSVGQKITPDQAMSFALATGKQGLGFVSPNPAVGCVIVDKDHGFLGAGAHLKWGEAHAEINALRSVSDRAKLAGATVYVTLEPCAHEGKTGSCAKALAQLPIVRVVYGLLDPNPLVSGKGLEILAQAGIKTQSFLEYEKACTQLCEQFLFNMEHKTPFIALKIAASLDGKMALNNGESQWITSEGARVYGRALRAHYDATLIGAGTFVADNPTLDFRGTEFAGKKQNRIVIFDPKGKASTGFANSNLRKNHAPQNVFVVTTEENRKRWAEYSVSTFVWTDSKQGWQSVLGEMNKSGISSLYVEGGAKVYGQLLNHSLVQKLYLFQAPKLLGDGLSWSRFYEVESLASAATLKDWTIKDIGEDLLFTAYC